MRSLLSSLNRGQDASKRGVLLVIEYCIADGYSNSM
jgi:hypothetical protein